MAKETIQVGIFVRRLVLKRVYESRLQPIAVIQARAKKGKSGSLR